jgi:hypothetical protein
LDNLFDEALECDWRWHRFEWQSRSSVHSHGLAKLKNDPGLIELTKLVYIGHLACKLRESDQSILETSQNQFDNDILIGVEAGKYKIN